MKRVLIACEESQEVCKAFRARGFEAYSCDIQEPSGGHPEWHILCDVVPILSPWLNNNNPNFDPNAGRKYLGFQTMDGEMHGGWDFCWDLIIAHPPCTDLAVSGARWFQEKQKDGRQQVSINFFMEFVDADCDKIAIENPIGIMSSVYRKPDQIIQPWQFGHGETKATCLWLKGLPLLKPTDIVEGREQRVWKMPPGPDRAKERSKTYPGIARAMAEQWGDYIMEE